MDVEPGSHNWTQVVDGGAKGLADRMNREAMFLFSGGREGALDRMMDGGLEGITEAELRVALSEDDRALAESIVAGTGLQTRLRPAGVGRGASGLAIAIEVLEKIGAVGGGAVLVVQTARSVRSVYRRLARASGRRPLVSLGAAEFLAAADLADRLGDTDFVLVGSGDVNSRNHDRDFTGGDAFYVIIQAAGRLHHYQVSAYGEVSYVGESPVLRNWTDPPPTWDETEQ
jgi:hypothetical protein